MLPLIPFALTLAPQIAKWIFGDNGAAVAKDVAVAIQTVTGADASTPSGIAAAQAALDGKPELVLQLQQRLAEIAATREAEANREADARKQAELAELKQRLTDVESARAQTTILAATHSPLAYGSAVLSGIILLAFAIMLFIVLNHDKPFVDNSIVNILLGTLAAMATQVANYWLGSSSGSAAKNDILREQSSQLAASTPGPAAQITTVSETSGSPSRPVTTTATAATQPLRPATGSNVTADELNQRALDAAAHGN